MKRDPDLVQAMDDLADLLPSGHLLLATNAEAFIDAAVHAIKDYLARAEAAEADVKRLRAKLEAILDCGSIRDAERIAIHALATKDTGS